MSIRTGHLIFWILGACILAIYSYPYLATWSSTGFTNLPPLFAPDLYLYLNLSNMDSGFPGKVINPWYGIQVPAVAIEYDRFGLALKAFTQFHHFLGQSRTFSVFSWNILWTLLIYLATLWLLRMIQSAGSKILIAFSLSLFLLTDLTSIAETLDAWKNLPVHKGFQNLRLPYIRSFFPQGAIPLLISYIALQVFGLNRRKWIPFLLMALIQILALGSFPYATLLMLACTGLTIGILAVSRWPDIQWSKWAFFLIISGVIDMFYLSLKGAPLKGLNFEWNLLFDPQLSRIPSFFGGSVILMAILVMVMAFITDDGHAEIKWTLVGLGLANILLLFTDAFLSPLLMISHHMGYFVHTTMAILIAAILAHFYLSIAQKFLLLKWFTGALTGLVIIQGSLVANGTFQRCLPLNKEVAELGHLINSFNLGKTDLTIAPAKLYNDPAVFIPLLTKAEVLFFRDADLVLGKSSMKVQDQRKAIYLYLTGRDTVWAETVLSNPGKKEWQIFLANTEQGRVLLGGRPENAISSIRQGLLPILRRVEKGDGEIRRFFQNYNRILVIEPKSKPTFVPDRVSAYLNIEQEKSTELFILRWCKPFISSPLYSQKGQ